MHLLATLGSSFAVVPEAYLMGNGEDRYSQVTVIATSNIVESVTKVREWFAARAPEVVLRILTIADLPDIKDIVDHARYEEALFRVHFDCSKQGDGSNRLHLCLAGGFKTISSAAHQTADLLGCGKLFHITSPFGERFDDHESILRGIAEGKINLIDLGSRPGWPTIRGLVSESPSVPPQSETIEITTTPLREKIFLRLSEANLLAQSQHELATLPFPVLATWPPSLRHWLAQPLDPDSPVDQAWIRALPKVELHCHLGGFATHGDLLHQVRAAATHPEALPPLPAPDSEESKQTTPPADWPCPYEPCGLEFYRHLGDLNGSALLRDPGCLQKQIELLYQHFLDQNIHYAEVRCSPGNYASPGRSPQQILTEIIAGFSRVAATLPACRPVATTLPACSPVATTLPACRPVSPPVPGDSPPSPSGTLADPTRPSQRLAPTPDRLFVPFDEDKEYSQSWRDLPHRHQGEATAFVTFRLADSLPKQRVEQWLEDRENFLSNHPKPWSEDIWRNYQRQFPRALERWLDEAHGSCLLQSEENTKIVTQALHFFDGQRYILDHYVVMPNHVHVLLKPLGKYRLTDILHSWKSFTARKLNKSAGRTGQLWQHESFDHLVRSEHQLKHYRHYIDANPEKASLDPSFRIGVGLGLKVATTLPACSPVSPPVPGDSPPSPSGTLADPTGPSQRLAPTINLIIIGTRQHQGDYREQIKEHIDLAISAAGQATPDQSCRVVGVDLAGYEDPTTRPGKFRDDFLPVHQAGLSLTVHAGENDDAEAIWSALFELSTMRLGHGLSLHQNPALVQSVAQRRIAIEMCPYANLQIKGFPLDQAVDQAPQETRYPLLHYLRANIPVTINTDNIGISAASLSDNFLLAARLCPGLTRLDILQLLRNAADSIFASAGLRQQLIESLQKQIPNPHSWQQASRLPSVATSFQLVVRSNELPACRP